MADIREQLILEDKFSGTFNKYINAAQMANSSTQAMKDAAQQASAQTGAMSAGYREAGVQMRAAAAQAQAETAALRRSEQASRADAAASTAAAAATRAETAALKQEEQALQSAAAASSAKTAAIRAQAQQEKSLGTQVKALAAGLKQKIQALKNAVSAARAATAAGKAHEQQQRANAASTDALTRKLKSLAAQYMTLKSIQGVLNLADTLSQTTARIDMMNDGLQTTAQLNDMIFESAQRSRGAYADTADLVAKLGNLAGGAFDSSREIVAFAEQVNKQLALSGASATGAQAAILQLTQALSSGALRGEELNSILEQAPTIAQTIAKYLGMTTGEMRELASQGGLTADVVKSALFSAADETNAKFAQMPMTFAQIWQSFQNEAIHAFQPVLQKLTELGNSPQFQQFVRMALDGISAIAQAAIAAFDWIASVGTAIANNWSTIGPIFYGVAAAIGVVVAAMALWKAATLAQTAAQAALNLALSHPVIMLIAIAIGVVVAAIARWVQAVGGLKIAWLTAMDAIQTAWGYLYLGIMTGIYGVMNGLEMFALGWQSAGVAVANFMGQMKANVLMILQNLINGAIDMINSFIALLNNLPGVNIAAVSGVTFGAAAQMEADIASNQRNIGLGLKTASVIANKAQRETALKTMKNNLNAAHTERLTNIMLEHIGKGLSGAGDAASEAGVGSGSNPFSDIYGSAAGAGGLADGVGGIGDSVGGSLGSDVGAIKKEVQMSQEELKSLVDLAERRYVTNVNLTAQTPVINVNGQNTGNTQADKRALANAIRDILLEQRAAGSIRATAIPT